MPIQQMLKYSIAYNLLNFQPILIKFASKSIVCKVLNFKAQYILMLHSPFKYWTEPGSNWSRNYATQYFPVHRLHLIESYTLIAYRIITQMVRSLSVALNAKCIQYRRSEVRAL